MRKTREYTNETKAHIALPHSEEDGNILGSPKSPNLKLDNTMPQKYLEGLKEEPFSYM